MISIRDDRKRVPGQRMLGKDIHEGEERVCVQVRALPFCQRSSRLRSGPTRRHVDDYQGAALGLPARLGRVRGPRPRSVSHLGVLDANPPVFGHPAAQRRRRPGQVHILIADLTRCCHRGSGRPVAGLASHERLHPVQQTRCSRPSAGMTPRARWRRRSPRMTRARCPMLRESDAWHRGVARCRDRAARTAATCHGRRLPRS